MFFNTKSSTKSSKSKFEGIIDSGFKAIILGGTVSIAVTVPMLAYTLRHEIEGAFTAGMMQDIMYFVAGFSVFFVLIVAFTIRSIANAYVKANALNAMAAKQQAQPIQQPQIMVMPSAPQMSTKEQKKIEAQGGWGVSDIDDIRVVEAANQTSSGTPFVF